jgi:hypothetical protein
MAGRRSGHGSSLIILILSVLPLALMDYFSSFPTGVLVRQGGVIHRF